MSYPSGSRLGPYEIQSPLGAGGMGEVYRARDTRLDRIVAVKVLASHLSASPELKQRMEREARAISSLNHPSICHLYDIGSHEGTDFLVMEFLEGETLAERLRKGPLPLPEVYRIGSAIAEALAIAHRQGIVHRDLKPGNIMLTPSGAKLMDFGLAKPIGLATSTSGSNSVPSFTAAATLSGASPLSPLTTAGSIIGTIQYMSPEQIEGKEADARSDIFAFGAVLYEMAAGKRPFEGKSQISLASSILEKDPDPISGFKPAIPAAFEHVVVTCLQKNPEDRYFAAHDIKLELQWISSIKADVPLGGTHATAAPVSNRRATLLWPASFVLGLLIAFALGFLLHRSPPAPSSVRTVIDPPEKSSLNLTGDFAGPPVLSPDGSSLAFTATSSDGKVQLWVRSMNSLEAHPVPETDGAMFPFWSPDGRSLGFFADTKLKVVELNGGSPVVLCDAALGRGGAWGPNGTIIFSANPSSPILRISSSGGAPVPITKIDLSMHTSHRWPFFLPDGKHFLYAAIHHDAAKSSNNSIYYASLDGRENRPLFRALSNAVYADGFALFARGDQLMAQAFNPEKGTVSGEPRILAKGVMNDSSTWHMDASAAPGGLLVFGSGTSADLQLVWMDRATKQVTTIADKFTNLQLGRLSPDGKRVALQIDSGINDIWVLDLVRNVRTRLTFGPVSNTIPVWSPDGKWVTYTANRNDSYSICRKPSDGSGAEEVLVTDSEQITASDWSRDGKHLLYARRVPAGTSEIWDLPLEGERKPTLLLARGNMGHLSPDGRWLAYQSSESGTVQVYVVAHGGGQGKWQVSANSANPGNAPKWSANGKELYYFDATYNLFAVPVSEVGGALQFGSPQVIVSNWSAPQVFYDVTPDAKKIMLARVSQQVSQSITVVTNFSAGLAN